MRNPVYIIDLFFFVLDNSAVKYDLSAELGGNRSHSFLFDMLRHL
jgi:hypothetical protein